MSSANPPSSDQGIPGGHKHFAHESNETFLALIEEQRENINNLVGGNLKLKKVVHATKQVVAGILYHVTADFEDDNSQSAKFSFKLIDRPWDQPQERVFDHQRVE
ncbi:uncharacterized protein LOC132257832 [Phlebotomus argentipes]|uniref:uncharacterized protein LOC132257832 n=1 Tax=Phlebotomus argentipes TaxID=94469 RepID=UPI002892A3C8|nr:uncharacterized protein LOC132257832 [Phlebotomus argentipes]